MPDTKLRDFLMNEFAISESQAYRDNANIRILLGNIKNTCKELVRYLVNETLKKAIELAKASGNKKLKELVAATGILPIHQILRRK